MNQISNDTDSVQIEGTYEEEKLMTTGMFNDRAVDLMVTLENEETRYKVQDVLVSEENENMDENYIGGLVLDDTIYKIFDYNGAVHIKYNSGCLRAVKYIKEYKVEETFEVAEEVDMWEDLTQFTGIGDEYNRYKNVRNALEDQLGRVWVDLFDDSDSVPVDVKFDITDKLGVENRDRKTLDEKIKFDE